MKIELRLYASLAAYMPEATAGEPYNIDVSEGTTIRSLVQQLEIPREGIKVLFLNGVHARGDEILKEGDRVGVFPAVGGG